MKQPNSKKSKVCTEILPGRNVPCWGKLEWRPYGFDPHGTYWADVCEKCGATYNEEE